MTTLIQDLRYTFRQFKKNPGFTGLVVALLALGIGANSGIYCVMDAVLVRSLPYKEAGRVVNLRSTLESASQFSMMCVSYPNFLDWKKESTAFESMAVSDPGGYFFLNSPGGAERFLGVSVSGDYFSMLGVQPFLGRNFLAEESAAGKNRVVILSHKLWQHRFGARPGIVGENIVLNDAPHLVIGVMPDSFRFYLYPQNRYDAELWTPLDLTPYLGNRGALNLRATARLKPGVSLMKAQAELDTIARRLEAQYPNSNKGLGVRAEILQDALFGDSRPLFIILLATVGTVLLIACANVANMLLARAAGRQKEMAVRTALGACRTRLLRQTLTENLALSFCGGALGIMLAYWVAVVVNQISMSATPGLFPRFPEIRVDYRIVAFTGLICLLSGMLIGIVPAIKYTSTNLIDALKQGSQTAFTSLRRHRLNRLLVVTETALSMVLLIAATLLAKSFIKTWQQSPGFQPENVMSMETTLPLPQYSDPKKSIDFYSRLAEQLKSLPGVTTMALTSDLPPTGVNEVTGVVVEGRPMPPSQRPDIELIHLVSPGYFNVMGIPLLRGRDFTERDNASSPPIVIINQSLARKYWDKQDPIGAHLRLNAGAPYEVVGIIADVKQEGPARPPIPELYTSYRQSGLSFLFPVVRTVQDPLSLAKAMKEAVHTLDPNVAVENVRTMDQHLADKASLSRYAMTTMVIFALLGLILAMAGIYGVISNIVSQRTQEIGIRRALGARSRDIIRMVMRQGISMVLIGVSGGLVIALGVMRLLASQLYGVTPSDPATFLLIAGVLPLVALAACWIPARRAAKVDPLVALHYE